MKKYIDSEQLLKSVTNVDWNDPKVPVAMKIIIDKMPGADVEEVIRCRNCINGDEIIGGPDLFVCSQDECKRKGSDYCSLGSPRKEEKI